MLLTELGNRRPKRAGKAFLEYDTRESNARREGDIIILPYRGDLQLCRLQKGWNQFVARIDYSTVWFGGTDENPFLVRIDDRPFSEYCKYGPEGFYRELKPKLPGRTYRRQGDIFACPIPFTWDELLKFYRYVNGWKFQVEDFKADEYGRGLFGTRHNLKGVTIHNSVHIAGETGEREYQEPWFLLAEGTVVAPDHTAMKLEGVHVLAQTQHLRDSRTAD